MSLVDLHSVCGYTSHGVPAFSNGTSNTWTNSKSYVDGVFMGYRWQCVEFARRWLWTTQRLLLPERNCAYCFASCKHVYRLKEDPIDPHRQSRRNERGAGNACMSPSTPATVKRAAALASPSPGETKAASATTTAPAVEILGPRKDAEAWEKVPAVFVKQGSSLPPVPNSLIVYPMSWGSPWGHIGVITKVDLERGLVYVADQNRYFHNWGHHAYSAVFPLEVNRGRYYIRDHESECKGWLTFPSHVEGH
ncbi:putative trypanothione synthetase [Leptomonas seymouri]|uniref:Putative trypanothione synthetase n=1 Tax=Leptomonas seymouri TaxID=5684 RepID=A0A0N1II02_LEPSE|nr:putative trypanothione synthetase [Leptomonas seymouri]|eukprot:KPI83584.1 putative trypanothione synthetase [Leptomonas seymouri]